MDLKFYFQGKNKSLAKISIVVCYTHMSSSRSIDSESEISLNNTKKLLSHSKIKSLNQYWEIEMESEHKTAAEAVLVYS